MFPPTNSYSLSLRFIAKPQCAKTHTVYPDIYQYRGISGIYRTNFKPESKLKPESITRRVLGELGLLAAGPTTIMEDNMSAITIIRDIVYNGRTKHIDVRLKNLRDHVKRKALELQHIDTKEQIADIFTKGLGRDAFQFLSGQLMGEPSLRSLQSVAREE